MSSRPELARWKITLPAAGTTAPLLLAFDESLDHVAAYQYVRVVTAAGQPVAGHLTLTQHETQLSFRPRYRWARGELFPARQHPPGGPGRQQPERPVRPRRRHPETAIGRSHRAPAFSHSLMKRLSTNPCGRLASGRARRRPINHAIRFDRRKAGAPGVQSVSGPRAVRLPARPGHQPYQPDWLDPIKYVPLNAARTNYLTLGGQVRVRYEHFNHRFFEAGSEGYYSQRLALHAALRLTPYVRVFGELYHGYISAAEPEVVESDRLDVHQAFVELHAPLAHDGELSLTTGRQELAFGISRLVGLREGPNIRRSFDAVRGQMRVGETTVQAFYGAEVQPHLGMFDNRVTVFERPVPAPRLWGGYSQFKIPGRRGPGTSCTTWAFTARFSRYDNGAGT